MDKLVIADAFGDGSRYFDLKDSEMRLPLIYISPIGTISIVLAFNVTLEIAVDKAVRLVCFDKFSLASNGVGTISSILHPSARIYQNGEKVYSNFYSETKKTAVLGSRGVLFTMDHLKDAYLVSASAFKGTSALSTDLLHFGKLDYDFTLHLFYMESCTGSSFIPLCNEIVQCAHYETTNGYLLTMNINGIFIRQRKNGDVDINCRPRHISCSPSTGTVHIRTSHVDMAVQGDEKAFVKRSNKRVHVSRSGMVVSDGYCTTSMDHFGRIVSAS